MQFDLDVVTRLARTIGSSQLGKYSVNTRSGARALAARRVDPFSVHANTPSPAKPDVDGIKSYS